MIFCISGFIVFYNVKARRDGVVSRHLTYAGWIDTSLSNMFISLKKGLAPKVILLTALISGMIGFFLPGKVSELEIKLKVNRAIELNKKGAYRDTINTLNRVRNQKMAIIHNELGVANLGLMNYEIAEKELKKSIKLVPQYSVAHFNLAEVYNKLGKPNEMKFELSRAEEYGNFSINEADLFRASTHFGANIKIRLLLALIFGWIGYRIPRWLIKFLQKRRIKQYESQLASGLLMVSNGLRAGLSLVQAIEQVSKESAVPVSQEFELILKEYRLGSSIEEALEHLTERMTTMDTEIFVSSVQILRTTGGNLVTVFENIVKTINERSRVRKKIKTMTAEGEAQAFILAILPLLLAYASYKLNYESFRLLYTTFPGWIMILLMAAMEFVGIYWMLKIVNVKI
jgi:tight adherence protein B